MVGGRLAGRLGVPLARREPLHAGQRLATRALELVGVEQVGEVRIGVDDADDVVGHTAGSTQRRSGMSERRRRGADAGHVHARGPSRAPGRPWGGERRPGLEDQP